MPYIRIGNLIDGKDVGYWCKAYVEEQKKNVEWEASFDLYDSAMRRGTRLWQEETGNDEVPRVWPDAAKLAAWLMSQLDIKDNVIEVLKDQIEILQGLIKTIDDAGLLATVNRLESRLIHAEQVMAAMDEAAAAIGTRHDQLMRMYEDGQEKEEKA